MWISDLQEKVNKESNESAVKNRIGILYCGDCFSVMDTIPNNSIDMVLCDLPYGVLNEQNPNVQWDRTLDFERLWKSYARIVKDNGAIVLFANGIFTIDLINSNRAMWKYNWVWKKGNRPTGFLNANKQPLRICEDICVFYKDQPKYNPQYTEGEMNHARNFAENGWNSNCYGKLDTVETTFTTQKYPTNIIDIPKEHPQRYHPTQKPVALCEYLIKTYTDKGDTVLDNCMGSGSTGIACANTGRKFIGIELNAEYFWTAKARIDLAL